MDSRIKLLFIGPPSKDTIRNQLFLLSNCLPIRGKFLENINGTISHLEGCNAAQFPDVIILDEQILKSDRDCFLDYFRTNHYINQMDTLIYIAGHKVSLHSLTDNHPLLTGYLAKPLDKSIFLKEIYPMISFTMI